jgi:hypothetical protein
MKAFISYALTLTIMLAAPGMALAGEKEGGKKPGWKVTAVDTTANKITVHSGKKGELGEDKTYKVADEACGHHCRNARQNHSRSEPRHGLRR